METGITNGDLEAQMEADDAALVAAAQRMGEGVTGHREFPPEDARRIVRAGMRWRAAALRAHERAEAFASEIQQRGDDAMQLHGKRGDAQSSP